MSNLWGIGAGIGGVAISAALVNDNRKGILTKNKDGAAAIREHAEWQDLKYGMGHWSGTPGMDKKAHSLNRLRLFGPMNLRIKWQEGNMRVNNYINYVILPNLIPIAIAAISLISMIGWGKTGRGFKAAGRKLKEWATSDTLKSFGRAMKREVGTPVWNAVKDRPKQLARLIFASPANFGITLGIGVLINFIFKRFQDSYGHDGQEAYFRDLVNTKGH